MMEMFRKPMLALSVLAMSLSAFAGAQQSVLGNVTIFDVTRATVADYSIRSATLVVDASYYVSIQVIRSASGTDPEIVQGKLDDLKITVRGTLDPTGSLAPIPVYRAWDGERIEEISEAGIYSLATTGSGIPLHNIRLDIRYLPRASYNNRYMIYVKQEN